MSSTLPETRSTPASLPALVAPADASQLSILDRWRLVASLLPDSTAVFSDDAGYSFAEADRLSDLMALRLVDLLGDSPTPVGALVGHDTAAVLTWLAVVKTGRMIVMLDPHLPAERLRTIAELAGISTCVVDARFDDLADGFGDRTTTRLTVSDLLAEATASSLTPEALAARVATDLALGASRHGTDGFQIVFTSGSTGLPKGVVQTHSSFMNDLAAQQAVQQYEPGEPMSLVLPLSFVAGVVALLGILLSGAGVYLIDPRDVGVEPVVAFLRRHRLVGLTATPHLIRGVMASLGDGERLDSIRRVTTLGEGIHSTDLEKIRDHVRDDALWVTGFGSSETIMVTSHTVRLAEPLTPGTMPTGRAIPGKDVRIVREDGTPAGVGETGDIIVVSEFLSGGYWKNDALNAEKFGVDETGRRFARQGDLGALDADGVLHIKGRSDSGVKVRGYLVEPSEIEAAFVSLDEVAEAVVVPVLTENAPTRLVAYVVPAISDRNPSNASLRRALRAVLPEYMVPAEILQLTALPRTERGKVDRQALPEVPPHVSNVEDMQHREIVMSTIWQHVLELPELNLDDDFMALGGDSLVAEEMLTLVHEHFGVTVPSTEILKFPTLREFTARVVSEHAPLPSHPDVITLNPGATGTPAFAFAGAGALALTFFPLSTHFPDTPVYAFQQHGLERRGFADHSIEAMAKRFLPLIRMVRPHGPYRLVGHSFGGYVAMEIARQLQAGGEEVSDVIILDTYLGADAQGAGGLADTADSSPAASVAAEAEAVIEAARLAPVVAAHPAAATVLPALRRVRGLAAGVRSRLLPDGHLPSLDNLVRQRNAYLAGLLRLEGHAQWGAFFDLGKIIGRRHEMRPFDGNVTLVIAEDNPDDPRSWSRVATGDFTVFTMNAGHRSLLREPHVSELAEHLREALAPRVAGR